MKLLNIIITQVGHPNFRGGGNTVAHEFSESLVLRGNEVTVFYVSPKRLMGQIPKTAYNIRLLPQSRMPIFNCWKVVSDCSNLWAYKAVTSWACVDGFSGVIPICIACDLLVP